MVPARVGKRHTNRDPKAAHNSMTCSAQWCHVSEFLVCQRVGDRSIIIVGGTPVTTSCCHVRYLHDVLNIPIMYSSNTLPSMRQVTPRAFAARVGAYICMYVCIYIVRVFRGSTFPCARQPSSPRERCRTNPYPTATPLHPACQCPVSQRGISPVRQGAVKQWPRTARLRKKTSSRAPP